MDITLCSHIRPAGQYDADTESIEATGADYDQALTALRGQVPEGWELLGISRWPV